MTNKILIITLLTFLIACKDKPKQETVEVDGQSVNVTTATEDNYEYELIDFTKEQPGLRSRDSLIKMIVKDIKEGLVIQKVDKKLSIIFARLSR